MARFSGKDIADAIGAFVLANEGREVPAIGKNGNVLVYGENTNPYKPVLIKEEDDEPVQTDGGVDFGIELPGDD